MMSVVASHELFSGIGPKLSDGEGFLCGMPEREEGISSRIRERTFERLAGDKDFENEGSQSKTEKDWCRQTESLGQIPAETKMHTWNLHPRKQRSLLLSP